VTPVILRVPDHVEPDNVRMVFGPLEDGRHELVLALLDTARQERELIGELGRRCPPAQPEAVLINRYRQGMDWVILNR
jgi:alkylated DNA repair dioxygenase AlkB